MTAIKIKCPNCGKVLIVQDDPSNASKNVVCPACREKNPFSSFKKVIPAPVEDKTELAGSGNEDKTVLKHCLKTMSMGFLLDENSRRKYPLEEGFNLIGRQPKQSVALASVAIVTDDAGLSRKHLKIEVSKGMDGTVRHWASNAENKNPTSINGKRLEAGDKVVLHDGDTISSSLTVLSFHLD